MEKIQIITHEPGKLKQFVKNIEIKNFNNLLSLDNYKINVFDLNSSDVWVENSQSNANPTGNMPLTKDFKSICQMIKNSKKTKIIICLPQNLKYYCKYHGMNKYFELKDIINVFKLVLEQISGIKFDSLFYENTFTEINGKNVSGAFVFSEHENTSITKSKDSLKFTTIEKNNIIFTTLNLFGNKDVDLLTDFLRQIGVMSKVNEYPNWLKDFKFNDESNNKIGFIADDIVGDKIGDKIVFGYVYFNFDSFVVIR